MKRTELRVDNIVAYKGLASKVILVTIDNQIVLECGKEAILITCGDPHLGSVGITKEILLKNGFKEGPGFFTKGYFKCEYHGGRWWYCCNCAEYDLIELNGVHDLQNAYQLVTKEELTLQL